MATKHQLTIPANWTESSVDAALNTLIPGTGQSFSVISLLGDDQLSLRGLYLDENDPSQGLNLRIGQDSGSYVPSTSMIVFPNNPIAVTLILDGFTSAGMGDDAIVFINATDGTQTIKGFGFKTNRSTDFGSSWYHIGNSSPETSNPENNSKINWKAPAKIYPDGSIPMEKGPYFYSGDKQLDLVNMVWVGISQPVGSTMTIAGQNHEFLLPNYAIAITN